MILADLIHRETGVPLEAIMLLRHSNSEVEKARRFDVKVEEYTALQPIDSKYDFFRPGYPRIAIVVTIVDDRVFAIYRIAGVEAEGAISQLGSDAYLRFEHARDKDDRSCRRFSLVAIPSIATGLAVQGWQGRTRTPVQRLGDGFFQEIEVGPPGDEAFREAYEKAFQEQVDEARRDSAAARQRRLAAASPIPSKIATTTYIFNRNPDVVAETLIRANGVCQGCSKPAPFNRRKNGNPYLEVHHRKPLAEGGTDSLDNAVALCPNCHRKAHFG